MRKLLKTIISAAAALALTANAAFAAVPKNAVPVEADSDETVTFIVEVEGDALLATQEASELGTDYIATDEAQSREKQLLKTQSQVLGKIQSKAKVESGVKYTYTAVLNGFAVEAPKSKMDEIKAIDGVTRVSIAGTMEPQLASAVEMTSSLPLQTADDTVATGYTGDGQVIAIIDSEFDTGHEFFSTDPQNPTLSKSDIADIIADNTMNVDVAANQVYKSAKIPFAYDYVNETADTYSSDDNVIHGTHVAGIAAGSNGSATVTDENGNETEIAFSGVAPEAQLVLMKVGTDGGLSGDAIIAAIDDAVKIGVCAINMSFGSTYTSPDSDNADADVLNNAGKAGVMILVSNGNSGIGYNEETADTDMPDYFTSGAPAVFSESTAVASMNNTYNVASLGILTAADGKTMYYKNLFNSSTFDTDFAGQTLEYVDCGYGTAEEFEGVDVNGKIALAERTSSVTFTERAQNALAAGAAGLIVYNTSDGTSDFITSVDLCLPAVMIEKSAGEYLKNAETKTISVSAISPIYTENESSGTLSYFTSVGVDNSLELKPEITAPGGSIYSSYPGDEYTTLSGTSMAAPHMTGVAALMNEYLDKNGIDVSGSERVTLIENMLMSAADIIYQPENTEGETAPYSPRVQGAGLVNTAAAMKTSAVFVGDTGKSKLSLRDGIEDTLTLDFTVKNITDSDVTYDNVSLIVTTDGYQTDEDGNTYSVADNAVSLAVVSDNAPESITVPANGTKDISITVKLDSAELAQNAEIYINGFYIDGYVILASSDEDIITISMPFTGFRGDWTAESIFDKTMYDEGGSELYDFNELGTFLYTDNGEYFYDLGTDEYGEYNRDKIAISPNGDGSGDDLGLILSPMREIKNLTMELIGDDTVFKNVETKIYSKYYASDFYFDLDEFDETEELPDGEYTFVVSGEFNYDGAEVESFELPVTVDRAKPQITDVSIDGDTLYITASDNNYLYYIDMTYTDEDGGQTTVTAAPDAKKGGEYTAEFDISGWDTDKIIISVSDYAMNTTEIELSNALGNIIANMTDYETVGGMTTAAIELTNSGEDDIEGDAILAFYDEDGALIAAGIQKISISAGYTAEYEFDMFDGTANALAAKLFIWDSVSNMNPLDTVKSFNLAQYN